MGDVFESCGSQSNLGIGRFSGVLDDRYFTVLKKPRNTRDAFI